MTNPNQEVALGINVDEFNRASMFLSIGGVELRITSTSSARMIAGALTEMAALLESGNSLKGHPNLREE